MRKVTRWTAPCKCVVEYEWFTEDEEVNRIHVPISGEAKCERHKGLNFFSLFNALKKDSGSG